ncbi:TIGR03749 family integrating conjugative element protein [Burkholderia cepacia]|uniref:TIGR03749 family integrating conjugative element protein n=1 Tax=Burkholderia cepacia TaxID=292 RepID=UPI00158B11F1|nr:TIGR03749 family integrating conjugative element protein [Burkholderia cepacia]
MTRRTLPCLIAVAALGITSTCHAVEILHWQRLPLAVPLVVGQERVLFIDRNVRVGVPPAIADHLRVQSAGGAVYLRPDAPIEPSRLQLQDVSNGALILVDIEAKPADAHQTPLEPVRIVTDPLPASRYGDTASSAWEPAPAATTTRPLETPVPVVLTRYAAQSLYAPLRTVEPVAGLARVNVRRDLPLDTLMPTLPVRATALAAWRMADHWVSAVRLTNRSSTSLTLDPRALQGDFVAATFQHPDLGPTGQSTDTTVVYLITRGHGLTESLLPAISPVDPTLNLPSVPASTASVGEADHEK